MSIVQLTGRSVGVTEQLALAAWMEEGAFVRHLRQARLAYKERRDLLLACLEQVAPGRYTISGQQAGFHCVLWLPQRDGKSQLLLSLERPQALLDALRATAD